MDSSGLSAEDRIAARRLRIERRSRVLKGEPLDGASCGEDDLISRQVTETEDVLRQLTLEGYEQVSSVGVACRSREVTRRMREAAADTARACAIQEEESNAQTQVQHIESGWQIPELAKHNALALSTLLEEQKRRCDTLLQQKDGLAERLRVEIAERGELYERTLAEQGAELALAARRVDAQVTALRQAHRAEVALLQAACGESRARQVGTDEAGWLSLWESLQEAQARSVSMRTGVASELAAAQDQLHEQLAEQLHRTRGHLMQQVQELGLSLQGLRASCALNAEKMRLNTELLRVREQEARLLRAEHKKTINRLQEKVRSLAGEVAARRRATTQTRVAARGQVARLRTEVTSRRELDVAQLQRSRIARHAARQAAALLSQVLTIDSRLRREQLGLDEVSRAPEDLGFRDCVARLTRQVCTAAEAPWPRHSAETRETSDSQQVLRQELLTPPPQHDCKVSPCERQVRREVLFCLVESSAGFLAPEQPAASAQEETDPQEARFVQLAACLGALGVDTETDLEALFGVLRPLARCVTCGQQPFHPSEQLCAEHRASLDRAEVLESLRDFTASRAVEAAVCSTPEPPEQPPTAGAAVVPAVEAASRGEEDWSRFVTLLPDDLENTWQRLSQGLTQHLAVLQDRAELSLEVSKLQAQNEELHSLLQPAAFHEQPTDHTALF